MKRCRLGQIYHGSKDSILDQKYEKQIYYIIDILYLEVIEENAFLNKTANNNEELIQLGFSSIVVVVCIFVYNYKYH